MNQQNTYVKPILKWAGGKTQLIQELIKRMPNKYNTYIEPFFGGGALYFFLNPLKAIIGDINPELINLYSSVAKAPFDILNLLKTYENTEEFYYSIRSVDINDLNSMEKAARTLYLNKTCYNGLYRVNKKGHFNTPYGKYKNPNFINEEGLLAASHVLKNAQIINKSYLSLLKEYAQKDDFIFLDPPYLPVGQYADFKRYTKEGFYEEDHIALAEEVKRLSSIGCHVLLTNSNAPLVYDLFKDYDISVIPTKRYVNSNAKKRVGEDVIVSVPPIRRIYVNSIENCIPKQVKKFPTTRYMGSKKSLLEQIQKVAETVSYSSVLDLFSGSQVVSYLFKSLNKQVISNDYMVMNKRLGNALISNSKVKLTQKDIDFLLAGELRYDGFVCNTFKDIYFSEEDNAFIDLVRSNIAKLNNKYKKDLAMSALVRACTRKRPRGIFTYTGFRYNDGRKDLKLTFEEQFIHAIELLNSAVFDNGQNNRVYNKDSMNLSTKADLVYIDPPYYSPNSDNEYVRRYHFVEGLARNWEDVDIQWETKTKKFKNYPTPFSTRNGAYDAFDKLFRKHKNSKLLVSYSSNSFPTKDEMISLMSKYKDDVEVIAIDHTYSFGNQGHKVNDNNNRVKEYLFLGV